jgi:hypothetical protein
MTQRATTLERAFELARSGKYAGVSELRQQLKVEGYSPDQLTGPTLLRQLRDLCIAAIGSGGA